MGTCVRVVYPSGRECLVGWLVCSVFCGALGGLWCYSAGGLVVLVENSEDYLVVRALVRPVECIYVVLDIYQGRVEEAVSARRPHWTGL